MTSHQLSHRQFVPAPLPKVFAFFSRPENLAALTPPSLGLVILTPSPIEMKAGALIDDSISVRGVKLRWTSAITAFDEGRSFADEQLRGPYASWRHDHRFEASHGGTTITDDVQYRLPLGPIGSLAHALFVRRQLEAIFAYRSEAIVRIFGSSTRPAAATTDDRKGPQ